jgi:uncharacterized membrane protein
MFKTNFWFVPLVIIFIAILLAITFIYLDYFITLPNIRYISMFSSGGADGARIILSTIAGSMMTVAGVVFSITLVALTLASSQFGPRLLRNYMKNRLNQIVLGTYVATFIYCLIILGSIDTQSEQAFIPQLSVMISIIAGVANIFLLIIFIHHISTSIQAENVIGEVSKELDSGIEKLFPNELDKASYFPTNMEDTVQKEKNNYTKHEELKAWKSGYLQALDHKQLLSIANEYDLLLEYEYRSGGYVIEGIVLIVIYYRNEFPEALFDELKDCFVLGSQRSPSQDPEYAIHQLVEVAARALSPGINDPYTAISCSDKLGAAIGFLMNRAFPSKYLYDEEKQLRIIRNPLVFEGVVDAAFNQIRQYGRGNASILIHLLDVFLSLAELVQTEEHKNVIRQHADMVQQAGKESLSEHLDVKDLEKRYERIKGILASNGTAPISPQ